MAQHFLHLAMPLCWSQLARSKPPHPPPHLYTCLIPVVVHISSNCSHFHKISLISLVYKCHNTCGKFHDSLSIFEKTSKVSPKKPKHLLRSVIWYNSRKECSNNLIFISVCPHLCLALTPQPKCTHQHPSIDAMSVRLTVHSPTIQLPSLDMTFEYFSVVQKHHQHLTLTQTLQLSIQMHSHACHALFKYSLKYL